MSEPITEPDRIGAVVIDRDGDLWRKGRTRWTCMSPVDGARITRVGRLGWSDLARMHGPLIGTQGAGKVREADHE